MNCVVRAFKKNFKMVFGNIIQLLSGVAHSSFAYETLWVVSMLIYVAWSSKNGTVQTANVFKRSNYSNSIIRSSVSN